MNVHCPDQDLLLLAHQELSWGRKVVTQAHVAVCLRCQSRLAKLTGASRLLADTIRGTELPRWGAVSPQSLVAAARTVTLWRAAIGLLVILTIMTIAAGVVRLQHRATEQSRSLQLQPSGGCRPDLPSDKCH